MDMETTFGSDSFLKTSKVMLNLFEVVFYCLLRIGDAVMVSRYRKIIVTKINQ